MTPITPPPLPASALPRPIEPLLPTLAAAAAATLAGDFLLWPATPGISLAIFVAALAALLLAYRASQGIGPRVWFAAALLLGASAQTAIEICLTNVAVLIALLLVLIGESSFLKLPAGWARWWEAFVAILAAPGRWFWLIGALGDAPSEGTGRTANVGDRLVRLLRIAAPAAVLAVIFTIVLGNGNAIFSQLIADSWTSFSEWLLSFDLTLGRVFFWLLLATFALAIFRPAAAPDAGRTFARPPGLWIRRDVMVAHWQSVAVLAVLNAIFFAVNTIDAIYLWRDVRIPEGMNGYDYIHEGTNALITATVLSALVLAALFHQSPEVSRGRDLRILSHVWIVQNLVLLAGVCLRWKLYLDTTHLLTAKRIHLACFLALVALGFIFLALHIQRGPDLRRLLWRNTVATFVLFYALQFLNTTGIAAHWNVSQWERVRDWGLDLRYMQVQGVNAWPALVRVARSDSGAAVVTEAREVVKKHANIERTHSGQNWRERQFRRERYTRELIAAAATLPPPH